MITILSITHTHGEYDNHTMDDQSFISLCHHLEKTSGFVHTIRYTLYGHPEKVYVRTIGAY
jgi:hypothetical protein